MPKQYHTQFRGFVRRSCVFFQTLSAPAFRFLQLSHGATRAKPCVAIFLKVNDLLGQLSLIVFPKRFQHLLVVFCSHLMEPPALSRAWRLFFANDQLDQLSVIDVKTLSDHGCRFPHQNPFSSWRIPCIVFFLRNNQS